MLAYIKNQKQNLFLIDVKPSEQSICKERNVHSISRQTKLARQNRSGFQMPSPQSVYLTACLSACY